MDSQWPIGIGVDPGFASMGVAVVQREPSGLRVLRVDVLESKKASKEEMKGHRVTDDDQRRLFHFWERLDLSFSSYLPVNVGVEAWRPFPGQMGGNAWKVGAAVQMAICACWARSIPVQVFLPLDIKKEFLGGNSGDKNQVGYSVLQRVTGLSELLAEKARTKHEHIYDAVALAVLALKSVPDRSEPLGHL